MSLDFDNTNIGDYVKFLGKNGHPHQLEEAKQILHPDAAYVIKSLTVGGWSSSIELEEFPGMEFNTVMFEKI